MSRSIEDAISALLGKREPSKNNCSSEAARRAWSGRRLEGLRGLRPDRRARAAGLVRAGRLAITPEVPPPDLNICGDVYRLRLPDRAAT